MEQAGVKPKFRVFCYFFFVTLYEIFNSLLKIGESCEPKSSFYCNQAGKNHPLWRDKDVLELRNPRRTPKIDAGLSIQKGKGLPHISITNSSVPGLINRSKIIIGLKSLKIHFSTKIVRKIFVAKIAQKPFWQKRLKTLFCQNDRKFILTKTNQKTFLSKIAQKISLAKIALIIFWQNRLEYIFGQIAKISAKTLF